MDELIYRDDGLVRYVNTPWGWESQVLQKDGGWRTFEPYEVWKDTDARR